jgi:cation transport ATPase
VVILRWLAVLLFSGFALLGALADAAAARGAARERRFGESAVFAVTALSSAVVAALFAVLLLGHGGGSGLFWVVAMLLVLRYLGHAYVSRRIAQEEVAPPD